MSKLKPLKGKRGEKYTFVPDLSDTNGSSKSDIETPCAGLLEGRSAQDGNPFQNVGYALAGLEMATTHQTDLMDLMEAPGFSPHRAGGGSIPVPFQHGSGPLCARTVG